MQIESPIEFIMARGLLSDPRFAPLNVALDTQVEVRVKSGKLYRLDMLIRCAYTGRGLLVVECDGNAFHTASWQVQRDRQRDIDIKQTYGVDTLRFTGKQINSNMNGCLDTILRKLCKIRSVQ